MFYTRSTPRPRPAHASHAPQFKLQCRLLGLPRWNFRKLRSLAVLEEHLTAHEERERLPDGTVPQLFVDWRDRVKEVKARGPRRARVHARALTRCILSLHTGAAA